MSVFDKDAFLNTTVTGANETKFTPVPIGDYKAFIDDIAADSYESEGRTTPILVVTYAILDEKVKKELGMDKVTVQDRMFLDVETNGALSFGINKNVRLGKLREAVGQNDPKKAWNPNMLRGAGPINIKVSHRYNKQTGEGPYAQIDRVAKG